MIRRIQYKHVPFLLSVAGLIAALPYQQRVNLGLLESSSTSTSTSSLFGTSSGGHALSPDNTTRHGHGQDYSSNIRIDLLENQKYVWSGNQWIPPRGVPVFTRDDMMQRFQGENTLWYGDSTMRRAYITMVALLSTNASEPHVPLALLDDPNVLSINKLDTLRYRQDYSCPRRLDANETTSILLLKGDLDAPSMIWTRLKQKVLRDAMYDSYSICRTLPTSSSTASSTAASSSSSSTSSLSVFDYQRGTCYQDVINFLKLHGSFLRKRYSSIVFGVGLHDFVSTRCRGSRNENRSKMERLDQVLQTVAETFLSPSAIPTTTTLQTKQPPATTTTTTTTSTTTTTTTTVYWRTHGFTSNLEHQQFLPGLLEVNKYAVDWLQNYSLAAATTSSSSGSGSSSSSSSSTADNFYSGGGAGFRLVDWGTAIWPRSLPGERIEAEDLPAHYGLEARTLMIQMLMQQATKHKMEMDLYLKMLG